MRVEITYLISCREVEYVMQETCMHTVKTCMNTGGLARARTQHS